MKLLLDENLPKKLKRDFFEHHVFTVHDMGWAGVKNGKLLTLITEHQFNWLLTFDQNISYQQNLEGSSFGIIVLKAKDNRYGTLQKLVPKIHDLMNQPPSGIIQVVSE